MNRFTLFALALTLAGCAFGDPAADHGWKVTDESATDSPSTEDGTGEPTKPDDRTDPIVVPPDRAPNQPMQCELAHAYDENSYWVDPTFFGFSPNGGLFINNMSYGFNGVTMSVSDGEVFHATDATGIQGVDDAWRIAAYEAPYGVTEFRAVDSQRVLARLENATAASVSADGSLGAVMSCGEERTSVALVDLATGATEVVTLQDGESCYAWTPALDKIEFSGDNRFIVVSVNGRLWTVETESHAVRSVQAHVPDDEDTYFATIISDFAMHPDAAEVVSTGVDGVMRRWSLPELEPIGEERNVGVFLINQMTYAPQYRVSPVAFSPDGQTLAWVNRDGDVVLSNEGGDTVLSTPPMPEEIDEFREEPANVPVTISFSPVGQRLGVRYYFTTTMWDCPGGEIAATHALSIDPPSDISVDASGAQIDLNVAGDAPVRALRAFYPDGTRFNANFSGDVMSVWSGNGTVEVTVEAHDGFHVASDTVRLHFIDQQ